MVSKKARRGNLKYGSVLFDGPARRPVYWGNPVHRYLLGQKVVYPYRGIVQVLATHGVSITDIYWLKYHIVYSTEGVLWCGFLFLAFFITVSYLVATTPRQALVKFNESLALNKNLRERIDTLRRERVVFDSIYKKLERELHEKKKSWIAFFYSRQCITANVFDSIYKNVERELHAKKKVKNFFFNNPKCTVAGIFVSIYEELLVERGLHRRWWSMFDRWNYHYHSC